ncbi:Fic family protein [Acetobacterium sp.]|uniref:Fic family protein n=1 Tax=Acetobacterium sp. TaxID=1872094 RepID=UPI002F40FF12
MNAGKFAMMLSDKHITDLKKLQHKYSPSDVSEFVLLLRENLFKTLPILDFDGNSLVYLENVVQVRMSSAKVLFNRPRSTVRYSLKAMEDEIHSTLSIENIDSSRESIRKILSGYAPKDESENRLFGMKKGLDFISDPANRITEETLHLLYMMTVGDFLEDENKLEADSYYRQDAVYIMGDQIEHCGLPHDKLSEYMGQLVEFIRCENEMNDLLKGVIIHFYIGYLHPYFDGNGRMARLLHLWVLIQQGYCAALFVPFSNYINATRKKYYQAFTLTEDNAKISGVLDATPFLVYFIEEVYNRFTPLSVAQTDNLAVYEQALSDGLITEKEKSLFNFILAAYGNDEFSTKTLEKDHGHAAYATIRSFVLKFTELGLLGVRKYGNRNKYFVV